MNMKNIMRKTAAATAIGLAFAAYAHADDSTPKTETENGTMTNKAAAYGELKVKHNEDAKSYVAQHAAIDESQVGHVIKKTKVDNDTHIAAPVGAETYLIQYGARNAHGEPILSTGLVTIPKGKAPKDGWPVLSYAHSTTGIAKECAPSGADKNHGDHEAFDLVRDKYLQPWLDKGYAVIQPDFEGLGTVGHGTYIDRDSLSSAINDMVRATREEFHFADKWYNSGWSQGGFAAISASGAKDVPSGLQQTLAIAPGDTYIPGGEKAAETSKKMIGMLDPEHLTYAAYALEGATNYSKDFNVDDFLTDKGKQLLQDAETHCLTDFKASNKISGKEVLKDDAKLDDLLKFLNNNSIANLDPKTPVRIFISKQDDIINFDQISSASKKLAERAGDNVQVIIVDQGLKHRDMVRHAIEQQKEFVDFLK